MSDVSVAKPTSIRYLVLAWACSLSMITYIDRVCFKEVEGEISRDLELLDADGKPDPTKFALFFTAFALSYSLFEVPSGWLGDRMGPRKVLCRIVIWWSIFTALTGSVWHFESGWGASWPGWFGTWVPLIFSSWGLMFLIRFLFGMGEAGAYPNLSRGLRGWFPYERRGFAQGLMWMFARWGGAVAPPMIALFAMPWGWRGAFFLFGVMGLVWVGLFWIFFRDTPAQHPSVNEAELQLTAGRGPVPSFAEDLAPMMPMAGLVALFLTAIVLGGWLLLGWTYRIILPLIVGTLWLLLISLSLRHLRSIDHAAASQSGSSAPSVAKPANLAWGRMLTTPSLWFLSIMYLASNAGWCFFITWDKKYYVEVLKLTPGSTALEIASGAPLFFGGIACMSGGLITDFMVRVLGRRWGRTAQGALAYFLGGILFLTAMWIEHPFLTVAFLCLASFMKDMAMGVSWATCIDMGHRYSGTVAGFMNMVGNLGTAIGPPIVASLAKSGSWSSALLFSACMFFLAAFGWLFIDPRRVIVYSEADHARLQSEGTL
jgi:MFS family permease